MRKYIENLTEREKNEFIEKFGEEILSKADQFLLTWQFTDLIKKGDLYFGTCPFHYDNLLSFCYNPETKRFSCSMCGATGNIIDLFRRKKYVTPFEAYLRIAEFSKIDVENMLLQVIEFDGRTEFRTIKSM